MDKHMPGMDGIEAMQTIRSLDGIKARIPIIACTADAMTGEREKLLALGFSEFVTKPLKPEILQSAIADVIETDKFQRLKSQNF